MPARVLLTRALPEEATAVLRKHAELDVHEGDSPLSEAELIEIGRASCRERV